MPLSSGGEVPVYAPSPQSSKVRGEGVEQLSPMQSMKNGLKNVQSGVKEGVFGQSDSVLKVKFSYENSSIMSNMEVDVENVLSEVKEGVFGQSGSVLGVKYVYGFQLPGHGAAGFHCGEVFTVGCLEHGYIEVKRKTCLRADCPETWVGKNKKGERVLTGCRQKWAGRLAGRAENRLKQVPGENPEYCKHISCSVPQSDYGLVETDFPALRRKVHRVLKRVGVRGWCQVFHPFRRRCPKCGSKPEMGHKTCLNCGNYWFEWYFSPHFHIVGYGWVEDTPSEFEKSGYVVHNIGTRKSIGGTILYILSHAGVHLDYHTITWVGSCSYNKLKVEEEPRGFGEREPNTCPTCGATLLPCAWFGEGDSPLEGKEEGEYWVDPAGWRYTARYRGFSGH